MSDSRIELRRYESIIESSGSCVGSSFQVIASACTGICCFEALWPIVYSWRSGPITHTLHWWRLPGRSVSTSCKPTLFTPYILDPELTLLFSSAHTYYKLTFLFQNPSFLTMPNIDRYREYWIFTNIVNSGTMAYQYLAKTPVLLNTAILSGPLLILPWFCQSSLMQRFKDQTSEVSSNK